MSQARSRSVQVEGGAGAQLVGILHAPGQDPVGGVLLAHCFSCSKDYKTMTRLADGLTDSGYAVLRFDFTGLGDSEGEFGASNLAHGVGDVVAMTEALAAAVGGPIGLLGHSLGGSACLLAAPSLERVRSVITLNAPSEPSHLRQHLPEVVTRIRDGERVPITLAGRTFYVSGGFLDDLEEHDQLGTVAQLGRPLLVLHALDDDLVEVAQGEALFRTARQPKAFVPLLDTDHLVSDRDAVSRALRLVLAWFEATLAR
jgi:uncharacterized protein